MLLILPTLATCANIPKLLNSSNPLQGSIVLPAIPYAGNSSTRNGITSLGTLLKLRCDPVRYGRNLKVESCSKVFDYMNIDGTETIFADRDSTQPHDLNLPSRATSSKSQRISSMVHKDLSSTRLSQVFDLLNVANR